MAKKKVQNLIFCVASDSDGDHQSQGAHPQVRLGAAVFNDGLVQTLVQGLRKSGCQGAWEPGTHREILGLPNCLLLLYHEAPGQKYCGGHWPGPHTGMHFRAH